VLLRAALLSPAALLATSACSREPAVLVTGSAPVQQVTAYRDHAERAVGLVEDLWGEGTVARPVRLDLPGDTARWAAVTGHPAEETEIPASLVSRGGVTTVVVHPGAWDRLTAQGRQAVVTHEVTHLAQPAAEVPWWLREGTAEFTAHRSGSAAPSVVAGQAWRQLAADPPARWPQPGAAGGRWATYAAAWSVCLVVAAEHGDEAVPRWHRAVADSGSLGEGTRQALDRTDEDLLRAWSAWWADQAPA
jgi:hypothetical protein